MATFLVDENLPPALAVALQRSGYHALHVYDLGLRGAPDSDILAAASRHNAILITQDRKFGPVARRRRTPGIIVIHLPQAVRTRQLIPRILHRLRQLPLEELPGKLVLLGPTATRIRPTPKR